MKKEAGTIGILNKEDILRIGFSTHDSSPKMFMEFLESQKKDTDIFMIAVQPKKMAFGQGLSKEVKAAIDKLEKAFLAK